MFSAIDKNDKKVYAGYCDKKGEYTCIECGSPLILKSGRVKTAHFAHKANSECSFSSGESALHMRTKMEIWNSLQEKGYVVDIEVPIGSRERIADLAIYDNNKKVVLAIEVQKSNISIDLIYERTRSYTSFNVPVLWVLPWDDKFYKKEFRVKEWQKWVHCLYFGKIYTWKDKNFWQLITEPAVRQVPEFYNVESGEYCGGYNKTLKQTRKIVDKSPVSLAPGSISLRPSWQANEKYKIPCCLIPKFEVQK